MGQTKRQPPKLFPVGETVGGKLFVFLLVAGWLFSAMMAAGFLGFFGDNISSFFNELSTQVYWLRHFGHLPNIRHDAFLYVVGTLGGLLVLLIGLTPFLLIALTTFKIIRRKGFTWTDVSIATYSTALALLFVLTQLSYNQ
jgi:hypothetical protein